MGMRFNFFLILFVGWLLSTTVVQAETPADSLTRKGGFLSGLSQQDLDLLQEYRDSFDREVKEIRGALWFKKQYRKMDTTVSAMDRSTHFEIGLDFTSRVLSSGRATGITGVTFAPSVLFYHRIGLYATLGLGFYTDKSISQAAPVPSVSPAFGFYRIFFRKWTINAAYSHYFNLYSPKFYRSILDNSFTLYNAFDFWSYVSVGFGVQESWSSVRQIRIPNRPVKQLIANAYLQNNRNATALFINVKHDFQFYHILGASVFTITPQINLLFGNDNALSVLRNVSSGLLNKNIAADSIPLPSYDRFFGLLNVEPGLVADWRIKNLDINACFQVAIPFNEFNYTTGMRLANPKHYYPYAGATVRYLFRLKKQKNAKKPG